MHTKLWRGTNNDVSKVSVSQGARGSTVDVVNCRLSRGSTSSDVSRGSRFMSLWVSDVSKVHVSVSQGARGSTVEGVDCRLSRGSTSSDVSVSIYVLITFSRYHISMREPTFRRSQSLYKTVQTIYFHHFSWSHKCILCKHNTTFGLSLINSIIYMAFPRQPLFFTETVPHNAYETVEGNQ